MNKNLYTVLTFARINTKRFFRDRLSIFFGIMFPLIFLFVFGGIFGSDDNSAEFRVALLNNSSSQFAEQFEDQINKNEAFNVDKEVTSRAAAEDKMTRSQLDATIVLPANFGNIDSKSKQPTGQAEVLYTQNNEQAGQTLNTILAGVFKDVNSSITKTASHSLSKALVCKTSRYLSLTTYFLGCLVFHC